MSKNDQKEGKIDVNKGVVIDWAFFDLGFISSFVGMPHGFQLHVA